MIIKLYFQFNLPGNFKRLKLFQRKRLDICCREIFFYPYHVELEGSLPDRFVFNLKNDFTNFVPSPASVDTILIVKGGCRYSNPPKGGLGQPVANFKNDRFSTDENSPTICHKSRITG